MSTPKTWYSWSWSCGLSFQVIRNGKQLVHFTLGMLNCFKYRAQVPQVQTQPPIQPPIQPPFQAVPPARPDPPVSLTVGADPLFPQPPASSRSSFIIPNITNNESETSRFIRV